MGIKVYTSQLWPRHTPPLTEANLADQSSKVFIVTGGYGGLGFELCKILYDKGATVYLAGPSEIKASSASESIQSSNTPTPGTIKFLHLDLSDLRSVKAAAASFASQEQKLDVLWNNAAVALPPSNAKSAQDHELTMATNCLGPFLFTQLLLPQLRHAAEIVGKDMVRIVFSSSMAVDSTAPKGGITIKELSIPSTSGGHNYAMSKAGNWILASEFAHRVGGDGIVSLTQSPGHLKSGAWRNGSRLLQAAVRPILWENIMGAYTALWAGLSDQITVEDGGRYGIQWGRWHPSPRIDIVTALKSQEEGGTGEATVFWSWCKEQTKEFE